MLKLASAKGLHPCFKSLLEEASERFLNVPQCRIDAFYKDVLPPRWGNQQAAKKRIVVCSGSPIKWENKVKTVTSITKAA